VGTLWSGLTAYHRSGEELFLPQLLTPQSHAGCPGCCLGFAVARLGSPTRELSGGNSCCDGEPNLLGREGGRAGGASRSTPRAGTSGRFAWLRCSARLRSERTVQGGESGFLHPRLFGSLDFVVNSLSGCFESDSFQKFWKAGVR